MVVQVQLVFPMNRNVHSCKGLHRSLCYCSPSNNADSYTGASIYKRPVPQIRIYFFGHFRTGEMCRVFGRFIRCGDLGPIWNGFGQIWSDLERNAGAQVEVHRSAAKTRRKASERFRGLDPTMPGLAEPIWQRLFGELTERTPRNSG